MHNQNILITINHCVMNMQLQIIKNNILMKQINDQKFDFHCRFSEKIHVQNDFTDNFFNMLVIEVFNIVDDFSKNDK